MKNTLMRTESVPIVALHYVPNQDTLLDYQGIGAFRPLFRLSLSLKTPSASNNTNRAVLVAADFTGGGGSQDGGATRTAGADYYTSRLIPN